MLLALSSFDEQKEETKATETKEDAENTNETAILHQFQPKGPRMSSPLASWCAICQKHANEHHLFKNQFKVTVSMVRQNQEHLRTRRNINNAVAGTVAGTVVKTVVQPVPQECPICSESFLKLQNLNCCGQKLCSTCIDQIIQTKHTQASEILALYLSKEAHQCPKCELGPVEHFACGDLSGSTFNRCTSCQFSSGNINSWPAWNGVLPKSLQAYPPGQLDCPFCRNTSFLMDENRTTSITPKKKQSSSWKKTIKQIERKNQSKKIAHPLDNAPTHPLTSVYEYL